MAEWKPSSKQVKALEKQVKKDQSTTTPAEKRLKVPMTFNQAVKKIARTPFRKKK